ncbi:hypothetical protein B0T16DRAFT_146851 [Cercophora newfieldiana]|uniref:Uncharacterized protein n=1 Tax=Cercophora newfieldiana TaxID=92897 RepID=A0AA39Y796_9PEZI|nr:hypothetical protein B0T16DRAFT_146851 [Cercophora newfieldiana]
MQNNRIDQRPTRHPFRDPKPQGDSMPRLEGRVSILSPALEDVPNIVNLTPFLPARTPQSWSSGPTVRKPHNSPTAKPNAAKSARVVGQPHSRSLTCISNTSKFATRSDSAEF